MEKRKGIKKDYLRCGEKKKKEEKDIKETEITNMRKMKVVIKIGGSILYDEKEELNETIIKEYAEVVKKVIEEGHKVSMIVGGGKLARRIIEIARRLGVTYAHQDILGIDIARLHANIITGVLKEKAYGIVPKNMEELLLGLNTEKVVISGGMQPGQSTNAVAAMIAEVWEADLLINASNVEKVYDTDPEKNANAKAFDRLTPDELIEILTKNAEKPGKYDLFDKVGCEIVKRSKIKLHFINGKEPKNVIKAVRGEKIGTIVE